MSDVYLNSKGKFVKRRVMRKRQFIVYYSDDTLFASQFGKGVWFSEPVFDTKSNLNRKLLLLNKRYENVYYVEYKDGQVYFVSGVLWKPHRCEDFHAE